MSNDLPPWAKSLLHGVARAGARALGAAADSLLADVGSVADGVSSRTQQGRERLGRAGVGRPPPPKRSSRSKRRNDEEDE